MKYKIEKAIPISSDRSEFLNTVFALEIGDSFFVSDEAPVWVHNRLKVAKKSGRNFVTRTVSDGLRVWRTA